MVGSIGFVLFFSSTNIDFSNRLFMKNWRKNDYTYEKLKVPVRPGKPREKGLTAIIDTETDMLGWMGLEGMKDMLQILAEYVDHAKFQTHHSLMLPHDYIREKIRTYRDFDVTPFIGGVLFELAYAQEAIDELLLHLKRIDATAIEISENYLELSRDERLKQIDLFKGKNFDVIYEFGRKQAETPLNLEELGSVVKDCLDAGIDHIIIEQDEIDLLAEKNPEILNEMKNQSWFKHVFLEGNQFGFPNEHARIIKTFGPDVNLCNILAGQVLRLEDFRLGMGRQVGFTYLSGLLDTKKTP